MQDNENAPVTRADLHALEGRIVAGIVAPIEHVVARIEQLEARIEARIEHVEARIGKLEPRIEKLEARIEQLEARIEARIEHVEARIEQVETALLTEFHKWASPFEMRIRTHSAALRALDIETEAIGDRATKLEGRQQPPTA